MQEVEPSGAPSTPPQQIFLPVFWVQLSVFSGVWTKTSVIQHSEMFLFYWKVSKLNTVQTRPFVPVETVKLKLN